MKDIENESSVFNILEYLVFNKTLHFGKDLKIFRNGKNQLFRVRLSNYNIKIECNVKIEF